jgi:hypothetical protein
MAWHTTELILKKRMHQHGLSGIVEAGTVCLKAEALYPGMFQAVSVKNATLHVQLPKAKTMPFKMIEGLLLKELNIFIATKKLPPLKQIRLTFSEEMI